MNQIYNTKIQQKLEVTILPSKTNIVLMTSQQHKQSSFTRQHSAWLWSPVTMAQNQHMAPPLSLLPCMKAENNPWNLLEWTGDCSSMFCGRNKLYKYSVCFLTEALPCLFHHSFAHTTYNTTLTNYNIYSQERWDYQNRTFSTLYSVHQ